MRHTAASGPQTFATGCPRAIACIGVAKGASSVGCHPVLVNVDPFVGGNVSPTKAPSAVGLGHAATGGR